jgi:hypothetical protein
MVSAALFDEIRRDKNSRVNTEGIHDRVDFIG